MTQNSMPGDDEEDDQDDVGDGRDEVGGELAADEAARLEQADGPMPQDQDGRRGRQRLSRSPKQRLGSRGGHAVSSLGGNSSAGRVGLLDEAMKSPRASVARRSSASRPWRGDPPAVDDDGLVAGQLDLSPGCAWTAGRCAAAQVADQLRVSRTWMGPARRSARRGSAPAGRAGVSARPTRWR